MSLRERFIASAMLAALVLWVIPGCSSSNPRDINYGTDVAVGFEPPDATAASEAGVADGGSADDAMAAQPDAAVDAAAVTGTPDASTQDAGDQLDASVVATDLGP